LEPREVVRHLDSRRINHGQAGAIPEGVNAVTPQQSQTGGSGSFLVLADDGRRYWCKVDCLTLAR
jgi:hypothetical protein